VFDTAIQDTEDYYVPMVFDYFGEHLFAPARASIRCRFSNFENWVFYDPTLQYVPFEERPIKWYFIVGAIILGGLIFCLLGALWYCVCRYYRREFSVQPAEDNSKKFDKTPSIYDSSSNISFELKLKPTHSKGFVEFKDEDKIQ